MVELSGVTKRFGDFVAVAGVDLRVEAGEFLTLLGPSGCGKTTLLRMISGFETPTQGTVRLDGQDVTSLPPYKRNVNQVFQSYALFPHLSVQDNVAFGLRMKKTPASELKTRVGDGIEMVGLSGFEKRRPHELSGGQRQRVALARALVCQPKVLLLDEPLAALDAKLRRAMQVELKRLQQKVGITFLFVTHDQDEAMAMSDRVAVINRGLVEQIGSATELYHRPATRFVADFLGQTNLLPARVTSRDDNSASLLAGSDLPLTVALSAIPTDAESLLISIRPEKIRLSDPGSEVPTGFKVKVGEVLFRGATSQLLLTTAAGTTLTALVANESASTRPLQPGDEVLASVHPDDIVVLPG